MVPLSIQLRQRSLKITALPMFASFMAATGRNAPLGQAGGHFMHSQQGISLGLISGVNKVQLPADSDLCGQLSACATVLGIRTESGVIASGDQFISSAERKDAIIKTFGAIACEMEGAAIGQVCYVNRVPFCVLRAISDSADGSSHMDYPTFVGMAAEQSVKLLRTFLRN